MINPALLAQISSAIQDATQRPFALQHTSAVGGGSINQAYRLETSAGECYFLKLNHVRHYAMFIGEAAGLEALAATHALRVPRVIAHGIADEQSYLLLEHLQLGSRGDARRLGVQLAALHRHGARQFGFAQDNFIGTTPQPNGWKDDWLEFWREHRLGSQLQLAAQNGFGGQLQRLGARLLDSLPALFSGYAPQPSLLHGDLWSGNHAYLIDGTPAIFDPAAYFGDREADLAMTELFGGFPADFYAAYRAAWPLHEGYATRKHLYNLYHVLNHANLFGGGYARQAEGMMQRLLA